MQYSLLTALQVNKWEVSLLIILSCLSLKRATWSGIAKFLHWSKLQKHVSTYSSAQAYIHTCFQSIYRLLLYKMWLCKNGLQYQYFIVVFSSINNMIHTLLHYSQAFKLSYFNYFDWGRHYGARQETWHLRNSQESVEKRLLLSWCQFVGFWLPG